ncbi:AraC family transcriptional regulator [Cellvibrio sp. pealriver]|uniref:helix-turn-helix domain-containing protein n=1 Tax=Cellvibrio sp. pealriver TaxID=1622269 RepID=UPI00066FF36D|nr:AraC family transcriptional regulator [Cellvibrio sp. pealriver]
MQEFYNKAFLVFLSLLLASGLVAYFCIDKTFLQVSLLPNTNEHLQWKAEVQTDSDQGGDSSVKIADDTFSLNFHLALTPKARYPYGAVNLVFKDRDGNARYVDLSAFDKMTFSSKCSNPSTLSFALLTFDEQVSTHGHYLSYRSPSTFFACNLQWQKIELDLTRLETAQWWFEMFKVDLSNKTYKLNQVAKLNFGSSVQVPMNTDTNVQISEITLAGHNWFYLYLLAALLVLVWSAYGLWFFRQHSRALIIELQNKIQRDRPLVAYQQISVEPLRDKDRSAILHFMATQYANPDLNLEAMAIEIGVSRTKINDILKSELGFTFTGYLNKLRLTEAARLLAQEEDANIAEIAYSVGYKNVSYFNKLFKEEYRCTPKIYKSLHDKTLTEGNE